jgi:hypothetical protein
MRSMKQISFFAAVVAVLFLSVPAAAITLGQVDRFGADNDMGWHPTTPSDAMLGGPGGASDYYLEFLSNGGSFSEGKMVIRNSLQWSGNYSSEGVRVISLDAQNRGDLTMNLRIAITNASGRPAADDGSWYATTVAIDLAPGSGWQSLVFELSDADMIQVLGAESLGAVLSNVTQLRILSSAAPGNRGDAAPHLLGVDNIAAIPEPSAAALLSLGLVGLGVLGGKRS